VSLTRLCPFCLEPAVECVCADDEPSPGSVSGMSGKPRDKRPVPPHDDLAGLAQASIRNAGDLLDDARFLLAAGRVPRAHALAILALDEIGKSALCVLALVPSPEPFYGNKSGDFWAAWRDHGDKLTWARASLGVLVREPSGPAAEEIARSISAARHGNKRKEDSLYVDYRDGKILEPAGFAVSETQDAIAGAEELFAPIAAAVGAISAATAQNLEDCREPLASLWEKAARGPGDAEEALRVIGAAFREQYLPQPRNPEESA
jgi:AbiV family abortive infection protein